VWGAQAKPEIKQARRGEMARLLMISDKGTQADQTGPLQVLAGAEAYAGRPKATGVRLIQSDRGPILFAYDARFV
jgi:hypothetical protein